MDEKRNVVRWQVVLPVRYLGVSKHIEGACETQDLSLSGARLAMVEKHEAGDQLFVLFDLPEENRSSVRCEAEVVWQDKLHDLEEKHKYITGIVFTKIRDIQKSVLLDYVNQYYPELFRQHWWNGL
ncbi:MAG: PilZ domain-containing protein [Candidatus Omnitrophota bacterium]